MRIDFEFDGTEPSFAVYRADGTIAVLADFHTSGVVSVAVLDGTKVLAKGADTLPPAFTAGLSAQQGDATDEK
jgi:hypothetical protein